MKPPPTPAFAADPAPALLAQALHLHQSGQLSQARALYENLLRIQPAHADALHLLGVLASQSGEHQRAVEHITRAIALQPHQETYHVNLGIAHKELGQLDLAAACFDRALTLQPLSAKAHYNKGYLLSQNGRPKEALACFEAALRIQPNYLLAASSMAMVLLDLKQYAAALQGFERLLQGQPTLVQAWSGRAQALYGLGRYQEALASFNEALRLQPGSPQLHTDRGNVWLALKAYDHAVADYQQALQLQPDNMGAHYNLGNAQRERGDYEQAALSFERAWTLSRSRFAPAQWNLAFVLLLLGDYQRGWACHEARLIPGTTQVVARQYPQPRWRGEAELAGKTLFVYFEQGLGDTLQFFRYARLLPGLGARVVLQVQKPLLPLFAHLADEGWVVLDETGMPPEFDFHCPLMSLPYALRDYVASIPLAQGYLSADPARRAQWAEKLGPANAPRIGLVWSGNPDHRNDANRSIAVAQLLDFLPPGFSYFSLHKELRDADRAALASRPEIRFVGDELQDFADTAALVELMDVVISVDTSVAHLSGALGKTTHVLLPHLPDWRWLLERRDSPWYASARLYRQEAPGDWSGALSALRDDLLRLRGDWQGAAQATPLSKQTPDAGTVSSAPST